MSRFDSIVYVILGPCVFVWLCHTARTTFVLLRSERTEEEKNKYTKYSVIHTYLFAGLWVLIIIIFLFLGSGWLGQGLVADTYEGLGAIVLILLPLTALAGIFMQKMIYARVLSALFLLLFIILSLIPETPDPPLNG